VATTKPGRRCRETVTMQPLSEADLAKITSLRARGGRLIAGARAPNCRTTCRSTFEEKIVEPEVRCEAAGEHRWPRRSARGRCCDGLLALRFGMISQEPQPLADPCADPAMGGGTGALEATAARRTRRAGSRRSPRRNTPQPPKPPARHNPPMEERQPSTTWCAHGWGNKGWMMRLRMTRSC